MECSRTLGTRRATHFGFRTNPAQRCLSEGRQANRSIELRNADKEILTEKLFETPLHSARRMLWGSTIQAGNEEGRFAVVGVNEDYDQLESIPLVSGRWLHQEDLAQSAKVCVIGQTIVDDLFKKRNPIGEYIRLRNVTFRVIGTFSRSGSRWTNSMALIPITTLQRVFEGADQVGRVIVSTGDRSVEEASAMASMADGALRTRHAVHPDDQRAVRVEDNNEEFAMYQRIFMGIRLFIWVIGGFTLFAGAIGVANIMSIVVKERTVEIGVRKALGATSGSIVTLIVVEAIALTSISGILGNDRWCADVGVCGTLCGTRLFQQSRRQPQRHNHRPRCAHSFWRAERFGPSLACRAHSSH